MKAIAKIETGEGLKLISIPEPKIAGSSEVLIEVKAASICGTDIHIYDWDLWAQKRIVNLPLILGHELSGVVVAKGADVERVKIGDRVAVESHIYCNNCQTCAGGNQHICDNLKILGIDVAGGFSKYLVVPEKIVYAIDFDLSFEEMALMEPLGNALYCASPDFSSLENKKVVVMGDGPAGILAAISSKALNALEVVVLGINPYRIKMFSDMGFEAIDVRGRDIKDFLKEKIRDGKFDVGLEMSGSIVGFRDILNLVKKGGRVSAFGLISGEVSLDITNKVIFQGLTINGINGRKIPDTWILAKELLRNGKINLFPLITHRFELSDFNRAFEIMKRKECGKVALLP